MGSAPTTYSPAARLAIVARGQQGAFTKSQAIAAGFSSAGVRRRVASGRWVLLHRGVLADAATPATPERDMSAAVLACGPGAALSHTYSGRRWGLDVPLDALAEVTVLLPSRIRPPMIRVHRTDRLTPSEAGERSGIRMTSPMRTLGDLGGVLEERLLELALDNLWRRGLVHPAPMLRYFEDPWWRSRAGTKLLRRLASERLGQRPSGSDLETELLQLIRDAGLPLPTRQHPVITPFGVRYLDLAYANRRIAIELDGMESRLDPAVFLDDRVRQNLIEAQGWTFRRFGHAHVTRDGLWTLFTLGQALGLRPVRWSAERLR